MNFEASFIKIKSKNSRVYYNLEKYEYKENTNEIYSTTIQSRFLSKTK
jgi:hypothetical protein